MRPVDATSTSPADTLLHWTTPGYGKQTSESTIQIRTRPAKIKTRPDPPDDSNQNMVSGNMAVSEDETTAKTIFRVTKRAFHTIELMFPPSSKHTTKGTKWEEFVYCLVETGFKTYFHGGAAVGFESERPGGGRIVFHKPHPSSQIPSSDLRAMGKRMAKWYGWSREAFILDKKVPPAEI